MSISRVLLIFAHSDEAAAFALAGVPHVVTGVGKINATLGLARALLTARPGEIGRVIVLGTAGAVSDEARLDTVYQITSVVQHDYSLPSPTLALTGEVVAGEALPGELVTGDTAAIATGDVFVQHDEHRSEVAALGATLVDMETYAYATVCERLGVPLQVFKVPSDFADSSTTQDEWDGIAGTKSEQLLEFAREFLPELFV